MSNVPFYATTSYAQEFVRCDACLRQDGSQGALWHVAWMIGDGGVTIGGGVEPDLVRASGLTVELEAYPLQALHDLPILETGKSSHGLAFRHLCGLRVHN